jgi:hypothetical protein
VRRHQALRSVGQPYCPAAATIKDAQIALFLRKLPRHISTLINMRALQRTVDVPRPLRRPLPPQLRPPRASCLLSGTPADRSGCRRSPNPRAVKGARNDSLCIYHSRFGNKAHKCEKGCSYLEN